MLISTLRLTQAPDPPGAQRVDEFPDKWPLGRVSTVAVTVSGYFWPSAGSLPSAACLGWSKPCGADTNRFGQSLVRR